MLAWRSVVEHTRVRGNSNMQRKLDVCNYHTRKSLFVHCTHSHTYSVFVTSCAWASVVAVYYSCRQPVLRRNQPTGLNNSPLIHGVHSHLLVFAVGAVTTAKSMTHCWAPAKRCDLAQDGLRDGRSLVKIGPFHPWVEIGIKRLCKLQKPG